MKNVIVTRKNTLFLHMYLEDVKGKHHRIRLHLSCKDIVVGDIATTEYTVLNIPSTGGFQTVMSLALLAGVVQDKKQNVVVRLCKQFVRINAINESGIVQVALNNFSGKFNLSLGDFTDTSVINTVEDEHYVNIEFALKLYNALKDSGINLQWKD